MSGPSHRTRPAALRRAVLVALLGVSVAGTARGQGGPEAPAAPPGQVEAPAPPPASPPPASPPPAEPKPDLSPSLDFELLPPAAAAAQDPELDRRVRRRRTMLQLHQGVGLALLASMAATTVVGQLDFNDRFRGGGDTGKYQPWHRGLVVGTSVLFVSAGLLGVLAPEPYRKKLRLDTATAHKASMALATVGMVTEIALGLRARRSAGHLQERDLATAHQVTGYATLGALTVGALVLTF